MYGSRKKDQVLEKGRHKPFKGPIPIVTEVDIEEKESTRIEHTLEVSTRKDEDCTVSSLMELNTDGIAVEDSAKVDDMTTSKELTHSTPKQAVALSDDKTSKQNNIEYTLTKLQSSVKEGVIGYIAGGIGGDALLGENITRHITDSGLPVSSMTFQEIYTLINVQTYNILPTWIKEFTLIRPDIDYNTAMTKPLIVTK